MGNLTRDPEMKVVGQNQASLCTFGIALNRKFIQNGEKLEKTTFVDCEAWGKTADSIGQYFSKGSKILLEGELEQDSWEDRETGTKRTRLKIRVNKFYFVDGKQKSQGSFNEQQQQEEVNAPF